MNCLCHFYTDYVATFVATQYILQLLYAIPILNAVSLSKTSIHASLSLTAGLLHTNFALRWQQAMGVVFNSKHRLQHLPCFFFFFTR